LRNATGGRTYGEHAARRYRHRIMTTIYRKTAKGVAEITTRAHRLVPRLRSALILVDGKRSDDELMPMVLTDAAGTLASLLADGFIEVLAILADRPHETAGPPQTMAIPLRDAGFAAFQALRRDAARDLNHQLGPNAEVVTLKIERAKDAAELQPLLIQGAQMLQRLKGLPAGEAFAARFIASAPE
jgi:hypothetical protein